MKNLGLKELLLFSIPSVLSSLFEPLGAVVDTAFVGQMNTHWLGSLAVGTSILSSFTWIFNFLIHVPTQAVAASYSAKKYDLLGENIRVAILVSLIIGIVSALFLFLVRFPLYKFSGAGSELIIFLDDYFVIRLWGQPLILLFLSSLSLLRGLGKVKPSFYLVLVSTSLNIFLSWYFLYHTDMGIKGVAYGTVLSQGFGLSIALYLLFSSNIKKYIFKFKFSKNGLGQFSKNSFYIFGRSALLSFSFYLSTKFSGRLGIVELAAHQILLQLWLLCSFFIDGLAITGSIHAAGLREENNIVDLKIMAKNLILLAVFLGFLFSIVFIFCDDQLISFFTKDPEVIKSIEMVWPFLTASLVFVCITYTIDGIMFGLEEFAFLRNHMMVGFIITFAPFAFLSYQFESLVFIWGGLISLGLYRGLSSASRIVKVLRSLNAG